MDFLWIIFFFSISIYDQMHQKLQTSNSKAIMIGRLPFVCVSVMNVLYRKMGRVNLNAIEMCEKAMCRDIEIYICIYLWRNHKIVRV